MTFNGSVGPGIDTYPLIAGIPPLIPQCNLTVVGQSGLGIYTYFIVANYPLGQVVSGPYTIYNAPNVFSGGNYVRLDWQPTPNATTYDILRFAGIVTSLAGITTNSEIATGLTVTTFNNTAGTIGGFTTNLIGNSQIDLAIENQTSAYARVYFNPIAGGPFELDLSAFANVIIPGGGSAGPALPFNSVQFNNAGVFGGDSNFEWDNTNKLLKIIGSPNVNTHSLFVGPDESTLVADIQSSFDDATVLLTYKKALSTSHGLGIEAQNTQVGGSCFGTYIIAYGDNSTAVEGDAWCASNGGTAFAIIGEAVPVPGFTPAQCASFFAEDSGATPGSTVDQIGFFSFDFTAGTNNYGMKLGVTAGANKWSIFTDTAKSHFGGTVDVPSIITTALTVGTLPGTPSAGQRAFVTDSNAVSFTAGIGAIVAAGGATAVPVVYDGTNWRIG